jgi:hypothetical protein
MEDYFHLNLIKYCLDKHTYVINGGTGNSVAGVLYCKKNKVENLLKK